jgi:hypothetical protein
MLARNPGPRQLLFFINDCMKNKKHQKAPDFPRVLLAPVFN